MKETNIKRAQILLGVTVLTLGILSLASVVRAAESPEVDSGDRPTNDGFAPAAGSALRLPLETTEPVSFVAVTESSDGEESASDLNRKLTNPVSSIWSISNQFNNFELNKGQ
jgi:hypothetical protein